MLFFRFQKYLNQIKSNVVGQGKVEKLAVSTPSIFVIVFFVISVWESKIKKANNQKN